MSNTNETARMLRLRLSSQLIEPTVPAPNAVGGVIRHLLAVQAQDFGQAVWAIGLRTPGTTRETVLAALESGAVVRSWPMRGTLHFVDPADLRWMLRLTAVRMIASDARRQRQLGLDQAVLDHSREIAIAALSGGGRLTRAGFSAALEHAGIGTTGQRGYHIIWYLAQTGLLCWGPPLGTQQALVLLDEWAPTTTTLDRDEALREFALRYFIGHGPATLRDFAWWSGLAVADAKTGLALARPELAELEFEGSSYFLSASAADVASAPHSRGRIHALPGFDEWLLGYRDRSLTLTAEHAPRIVPGNNGVFLPMILSKGHVVGTWRRKTTTAGVAVTARPFEGLTASEAAAFAGQAAAYGAFLGLPSRVQTDP